MAASLFDKDTIARPQAWRMAMLISPTRLHVVARRIVGEDALITKDFNFDLTLGSVMRSLEEVVYTHPVLLGDFSRVDCLLDSPHMLIAPHSLRTQHARHLWADQDLTLTADRHPRLGIDLISGTDPRLLGFLRRSISNHRTMHRLSPLLQYFSTKSRLGNARKMYVNAGDTGIDILVFDNSTLRLANQYPCANTDEALYYTLLAARATEFDLTADDIQVCGTRRQETSDILRRYAASVMPVIFPSDILRSGPDALNVPFELIASLLCE